MAEARELLSGTKELAATNTAERLTGKPIEVTAILVRARKANAANIHIGPSSVGAESYELEPGESVQMDFIDAGQVWVYGTEHDKVQYLGLRP